MFVYHNHAKNPQRLAHDMMKTKEKNASNRSILLQNHANMEGLLNILYNSLFIIWAYKHLLGTQIRCLNTTSFRQADTEIL